MPLRLSTGTKSPEPFSPVTESEDEDVTVGKMLAARHVYDQPQAELGSQRRQLPQQNIPPRRQSLMPLLPNDDGGLAPRINMAEHLEPLDSWSIDSPQESILETRTSFAAPMDREYMPPPLSPKRSISPAVAPSEYFEAQLAVSRIYDPARSQHARQETMESTSWLDTIDESGASSPSSVHSRSSFTGLRRKHIRAASSDTGAEFDAALDAAIEEAYDDGFEPVVESPVAPKQGSLTTVGMTGHVSNVRFNNDIAKENDRNAERDALIAAAHEQEKNRQVSLRDRSESMDMEYGEDDSDEEERILEEMTRGYILDDSEYDLQSKSALPRQSDSSGFSGRTWGSSNGSNPTTAGTTLSSVAEQSLPPILPSLIQSKMALPPTRPPPSGALPPPPPALLAAKAAPPLRSAALRPPGLVIVTTPGVRERRLSGQKIKQLKIDTTALLPPGMEAPRTQPISNIPSVLSASEITDHPKSASLVQEFYQQEPDSMLKPSSFTGARQVSSPFPAPSQMDSQSGISPATPASIQTVLNGTEGQNPPRPHSPIRILSRAELGAGKLRKNYSSSSLRSIKQSGPTVDDSPSTPLSRVFSSTSQLRSGQLPAVPSLPTPINATFMASGLPAGSINYFDTDLHSTYEPGAPNPAALNPPLALEACPESFLLRPFWLMRCMYHVIAHPRGGYLSTRLFVPRDIWRVRNVKLKNVDDKVASCDLLTAALHKLSKVDTLDADAVLEEMQSFELVLDQVQAALSKKLGGGEVGLQGSGALFRASSTIDEAETLGPRSTNTSSKSYLSGWRKLRSKNSSGPGIQPPIGNMAGRDGLRETLTMRSLPMTSSLNRRFPRRDVKQVQGVGPHGHYMVAIARLCDAVQVLGM